MMQHTATGRRHPAEGDMYWTKDALRRRLVSSKYDPDEFDLLAMLPRLNDGTDTPWFEIIRDHHIARRTTVPCPDWCELPPGHRYLIDTEEGEPHKRSHHVTIDTGLTQDAGIEELGMQIMVDELRDNTDDSNVRTVPPRLYLMVEGELTTDEARKLAAALLAATHKMREMEQ